MVSLRSTIIIPFDDQRHLPYTLGTYERFVKKTFDFDEIFYFK